MKWWQGGSHLFSMDCDVAEQEHVPACPSALQVESGLQIVLALDLSMKKLTVITWHVAEATETRMRKLLLLIFLLPAVTQSSAQTVSRNKVVPGVLGNDWHQQPMLLLYMVSSVLAGGRMRDSFVKLNSTSFRAVFGIVAAFGIFSDKNILSCPAWVQFQCAGLMGEGMKRKILDGFEVTRMGAED